MYVSRISGSLIEESRTPGPAQSPRKTQAEPNTPEPSPAAMPQLVEPFLMLLDPCSPNQSNFAISVTQKNKKDYILRLAVFEPQEHSDGGEGNSARTAFVVSLMLKGKQLVPCQLKLERGRTIAVACLKTEVFGDRNLPKENTVNTGINHCIRLTADLLMHSRAKGEIVFADLKQGLLLQPDGTWEKYSPKEVIGRVAFQTIESVIQLALADYAWRKNIPVLYSHSTCSNPALRRQISLLLKGGATFHDIESLLVRPDGTRDFLQTLSCCSNEPVLGGMVRITCRRKRAEARINFRQLLADVADERLPYPSSAALGPACHEINAKMRECREKTRISFLPIIKCLINTLKESQKLDCIEIRSLTSFCEKAEVLPNDVVDLLIRFSREDPHKALPILARLVFSSASERFPYFHEQIRVLADSDPKWTDRLLCQGIKDNRFEYFDGKIINDSVFEAICCNRGRIVLSQRYVHEGQIRNASDFLNGLYRTQFDRIIGSARPVALLNSHPFSLAPNLALLYKDPDRHPLSAVFAKSSYEEGLGWVVQLSYQNNAAETIESPQNSVKGSPDWITAVEDSAMRLLVEQYGKQGQKQIKH